MLSDFDNKTYIIYYLNNTSHKLLTPMHVKELMEFGLGENEAKVYLALLSLEIATANEIAKASGVHRASVYVALEALQKRGFLSLTDEKKVRQYIATSPEILLRSAEDIAQRQQNLVKKIEKIIPDMKALYKGTKKKPIIKVFEGKEGLISAFEDTLKSKEKVIRVSSSPSNLGKFVHEYIPTYLKKRYELGIKMFGIHPYNEIHKKFVEDSPHTSDEYALIMNPKYDFSADVAIYDNKIAYMTREGGGTAVVLESKEISGIMKSIFDLAFEEAKRTREKIEQKNVSK